MSQFSRRKIGHYMEIAKTWAAMSKQANTKVGAVAIGPTDEALTSGYNGAPRGCNADEDDRITQRPEKYFWMAHAEMNVICNAARAGTSLMGASLFTTHFPCMDCARAIVQSGFTSVFSLPWDADFYDRWGDSIRRSIRLFLECGIDIHFVGDHETIAPCVTVADAIKFTSIYNTHTGGENGIETGSPEGTPRKVTPE